MASFAWMSSPQYLAQVGHGFGACSVVLTAALFSLALGAGWAPILVVLGAGIALAALKEFVFDVASWGEGDSWADSAMDFGFYVLGAAVGTGLAALALHLAPR